jgi:hypothetical protein
MVFAHKVGIVSHMKRGAKLLFGLAFLAASALCSQAEISDNPYSTILARNPFGLKDPPPPPPPPADNTPAAPPAKVTVTGFVSMFGQPQVLLEIFDEPGKAGTPKKPILREGERMGAVEVLAIDVTKNIVKIRNGNSETNLTFEVAKTTAGPVPGTPPPPAPLPTPGMPQAGLPGQPPGVGAPTVVGANAGNSGGSGVTLMGGGSTPPGSPTATPSIMTGSIPPPLGTTDPSGLRSIPTRPIRTDANGNPIPGAMPPQFPQLPRTYTAPPVPGGKPGN